MAPAELGGRYFFPQEALYFPVHRGKNPCRNMMKSGYSEHTVLVGRNSPRNCTEVGAAEGVGSGSSHNRWLETTARSRPKMTPSSIAVDAMEKPNRLRDEQAAHK